MRFGYSPDKVFIPDFSAKVKAVTGRHSVFFKAETEYPHDWTGEPFRCRNLFDLVEFVFSK